MVELNWLKIDHIVKNVEGMTDEKFELYRESIIRNLNEIKTLANEVICNGKLPEEKKFIQNDIYYYFYVELSIMAKNNENAKTIFDLCRQYMCLVDDIMASDVLETKDKFLNRLNQSSDNDKKKNLLMLKKNLEDYFSNNKSLSKYITGPVKLSADDIKLIIEAYNKESKRSISNKTKELEKNYELLSIRQNYYDMSKKELVKMNEAVKNAGEISYNGKGEYHSTTVERMTTTYKKMYQFLSLHAANLNDDMLKEQIERFLPPRTIDELAKFYSLKITQARFRVLGVTITKKYKELVEEILKNIKDIFLSVNIPYPNKKLSYENIDIFRSRSLMNRILSNISFSTPELIEAVNKGKLDNLLIEKIVKKEYYNFPEHPYIQTNSNFEDDIKNIDIEDLDVYFRINESVEQKEDNNLFKFLTVLSEKPSVEQKVKKIGEV